MQFEAFRGRNIAEALAQVRAAYGNDAVIGSTRVLPNANGPLGSQIVEVSAAPANEKAAPVKRSPFSLDVNRGDPKPAKLPALRTPSAASATSAGNLSHGHSVDAGPRSNNALSSEIRTLRALVEEMAAQRKPKDRALHLLSSMGIEGSLAAELAMSASKPKGGSNGLRNWLRNQIKERLSTMPSPIEKAGPRLVACVGPAGVGKTTTLAKLAARAHIELGRSVSVITLDTFRVGAVEQMRRFCQLIGVPFEVAQDTKSFAQAVASSREQLVLVDTPSRSPSDTTALRRMVDCLRAVEGRPSDVLLTVPASLRARDLDRLASAYEACSPTGVVITKVDETDQVGGAIHAALRGPWPVAYLCDGPRVPEDIHEATVEMVLDRVFGDNK